MRTATAVRVLLMAAGVVRADVPQTTKPPDTVAAMRALAERGDAAAQYLLGQAYDRGDGIEQDYLQAVAWWRKAAAQGLARWLSSVWGVPTALGWAFLRITGSRRSPGS